MREDKKIPFELKLVAAWYLLWTLIGIGSIIVIISLMFNSDLTPNLLGNMAVNQCFLIITSYVSYKIFKGIISFNDVWRRIAIVWTGLGLIISLLGFTRLLFQLSEIPIQIISPIPQMIPHIVYAGILLFMQLSILLVITKRSVRELFEKNTEVTCNAAETPSTV